MSAPGRELREPRAPEPIPARAATIAAVVVASLALTSALLLSGQPSESASLVQFVGRFHTLLVHLPIGVLLLVVLGELLSFVPRLRSRIDPALDLILPLLVVSAFAAFFLGLLLARGGGFPRGLIAEHRNLTLIGIVLSAGAWALWSQSAARPGLRAAYRGVLAAALGFITLGAHHGGTMTRGEGYLTKHAPAFVRELLGEKKPPKPSDEQPEPSEEPLVFEHVVLPVLKARCLECHGPEQVKGGLRVDDLASLLKGGESGPAVVAGSVDKSPLVTRVMLPLEHDDHMPPADKPQLSADELELLKFWIERGASDTLRVKDTLAPEGARTILLRAIALPNEIGGARPVAPSSSSSAASSSSAPLATSEASVSLPSEPGQEGSVWSAKVKPVLDAHCVRCHGPDKRKGRLRVDSIEALLSGGKGGPALVPNDAKASPLVAFMRLPLDHADHMPPKKEGQPSPLEIELIAFWVDHGASSELKLSALDPKLASAAPAATTSVVATGAPSATIPPPPPAPSVPATSEPDVAVEALPAELALYTELVDPVLRKRCGSCHEGKTASGGFRVDDHAAMLSAAFGEPAVIPGKPRQSLLIQRVLLPLSHDEHMPPSDHPQLTRGERELIELWISKGAGKELSVAARELSHAGRGAAKVSLDERAAPPATSASASAAPPTPASASASSPAAPSSQPSAVPSGAPSASAGPSAEARAVAPQPPGGGCASCRAASAPAERVGGLLALLGVVTFVTRRAFRWTRRQVSIR